MKQTLLLLLTLSVIYTKGQDTTVYKGTLIGSSRIMDTDRDTPVFMYMIQDSITIAYYNDGNTFRVVLPTDSLSVINRLYKLLQEERERSWNTVSDLWRVIEAGRKYYNSLSIQPKNSQWYNYYRLMTNHNYTVTNGKR